MIRRVAGFVALFSVFAACATKDPTNPGTPIGTFNVTGTLTKSTCGTAPSPWTFSVKMNHDGDTLYWIQGGFPIAGDVDTRGASSMTSSFTDVARDATQTLAECDITRNDSLSILLSDATAKAATDPGTATTFFGSLTYAFSVPSGSDCSDQLTAAGGGYDNLPCEVDYTITGTLGTTAAASTTTSSSSSGSY
jgi:hypothetical protein